MQALILLALGYLVDFFDLTLFAAARHQILDSFQIPAADAMHVSRLMFNAQALGIVCGGIVSGVWGDKIGRMSSVRVGIFIYSTAILLSAYTTSVSFFILLRFISGAGLAGELAASVTYMTETWSDKKRDLATSTIYFAGVLGGILATVLSAYVDWKILFIVGAFAGYGLLLLRLNVKDSSVFHEVKNNENITRGSLIQLFCKKDSLIRVLALIVLLVPFWFMVYFINFGPEVAKQIGLQYSPSQQIILGCFFIGSVIGTYAFGSLSFLLKSRKKTLVIMLIWMFVIINLFLFGKYLSLFSFYILIVLLGIGCGYPGAYTTLAAESFGTNQRATGTCVVSCIGRGSLVIINYIVPMAILYTGSIQTGIIFVNVSIFVMGIIALSFLEETHQRSIEFLN